MFSFIVISLQILFVIMLGSFYRSSSYDWSYSQSVTFGLMTILGFVLMNSPYRKLSIFSLTLLLFVSFIAIQTNILFMTFWTSVFSSFSKEVNIGTSLLVNSIYAALCVIITSLDFLGLFQYWQIFAMISFFMTIGFGFCSALIQYGLDTYDSGSGVSLFLFSGMCSLIIWLVSVRGKISILQHKKSESYVNYTLGFVGVAVTLFSWPVLNMGGSLMTFINTNLASSSSLASSAYINTLSALGVSIIISAVFSSSDTQSQKLKPKVYIQCFINAGIIVSSYNDLCLSPVAGMILAVVITILTLVVQKYMVTKTDVRNQSDFKMVLFKFSKIIFRIVWSFLGICIAAIVVKTRSNSSLWLVSTSQAHGTKAGLLIAAWLIVSVVGLVFGIICAVSINVYMSYRLSSGQQEKILHIVDQLFFDELQSQIFPIYKDILEVEPEKTYEQDLTRRMLHQSLVMQQKIPMNIYETNKINSNHDTNQSGNVQKQTLIIKNDFSKTNLEKKDINLSAMKTIVNQEPVGVQNVHQTRQKPSTRQKIDPSYSPIDQLKGRQSMFDTVRPIDSISQHPRSLNTIPTNSKLADIQVIEQEQSDRKVSDKKQEEKYVRKKLTFEDKLDQSIQIQNVNRINS